MVDREALKPGTSRTYERTFTRADVEQFVEVSHDEGHHHLVPDADGRLLVHGLLTATLPTKIGGDLNVLARSMQFEFPRPVYTGQTVTCELTVETVGERPDRYELTASSECTATDGEVVLRADIDGVVLKDQ